MVPIEALTTLALVAGMAPVCAGDYSINPQSLSEAMMLREMMARMGGYEGGQGMDSMKSRAELDDALRGLSQRELASLPVELRENLQLAMQQRQEEGSPYAGFPYEEDRSPYDEIERRRDSLFEGVERRGGPYEGEVGLSPSLRDQEYLSHSHLLGNMLAQMPPDGSYGTLRIKPASAQAPPATTQRKPEGGLPAYCNPPNPCPLGYTAADGCQEVVSNTAAFSRAHQARQQCMCDAEHMFDCPDSSRESDIGVLARSIQNEGVVESTLDRLVSEMTGQRASNPYLQGEKLPIAAKKGVLLP